MHRIQPVARLPMGFGVALVLFSAVVFGPAAFGQWNPHLGQWGKDDANRIRVMTWNVYDGICSTNAKQEGMNNWTAIAMIVAAMQPDVLLLQETGDNSGNGTGSSVDSVSALELTLDRFMHGGLDPFNGNAQITAYVQKYAPAGYDLPYVFVSDDTDGYNRNAVLSRFPFKDLNGDGRYAIGDLPFITSHKYAPGGTGGIRGIAVVEIDLPDATFKGDLVAMCGHLKAGSGSYNEAQRLEAAQNTAYYIEHLFNGAGQGIPDPYGKIYDNPAATRVLDADTAVILGGDLNEDESGNGRDGPALWLARAQYDEGVASDGTDRDGSDALYDDAADPIDGDKATYGSYSKLDYQYWQDDVCSQVRAFLFESSGKTTGQMPPELSTFPAPVLASSFASDHRPVMADYDMAPASGANTLFSSVSSISQATGGAATFTLKTSTAHAHRDFLMFGSVTGTLPGTPLPGGSATLPLNWDLFTNVVIAQAGGPAFVNFLGQLDGAGNNWAQFNTLGPLPAGTVGVTLYFAFALPKPWDFASNAVAIDIIP